MWLEFRPSVRLSLTPLVYLAVSFKVTLQAGEPLSSASRKSFDKNEPHPETSAGPALTQLHFITLTLL